MAMDTRLCLFFSLLETFVALRLQNPQSLVAFSPTSSLKLFSAFFFVQYALVKFYRIFVYPFWFSPLRHLPGPKVQNSTSPSPV